MAWEWSHTDDAYRGAARQVERLPRRELLVILREWAYYDREVRGTIRHRHGARRPAGFRLPNGLARLSQPMLAELVWQRAEEHRTCTTGGRAAYTCPYGCHTVPFEAPEGAEDTED